MTMQIRKAERRKAKLRCCLCGTAGSGKTWGSLLIATGLNGKICIIDTESGSADLYATDFSYDVLTLDAPYTPKRYRDAIQLIENSGYEIIVIDSLTHAWAGVGGALDMHQETIDKQRGAKNSWTAWRDVTPEHNKLVDAMLHSKCHVIATMRSKTVHEQQRDSEGKSKIIKMGLAPIQREGMDFEFTVVIDVHSDHLCTTSKDRTHIFDGTTFKISQETGVALLDWLNTGKDMPEPAKQPPAASQATKTEPSKDWPRRIEEFLKLVAKCKEIGVLTNEELEARLKKNGKADWVEFSENYISDYIKHLNGRIKKYNDEKLLEKDHFAQQAVAEMGATVTHSQPTEEVTQNV